MSEVTELENQKDQYKELIATRDAIKRLESNPDFKKIIIDQYCIKECARYIGVAGDPAVSKEDRDLALEMGKAGQHLKRWLNVSIRMGDHAKNELPELENAITEAQSQSGE